MYASMHGLRVVPLCGSGVETAFQRAKDPITRKRPQTEISEAMCHHSGSRAQLESLGDMSEYVQSIETKSTHPVDKLE